MAAQELYMAAYGCPKAAYGCSEGALGWPWGCIWLLRGCNGLPMGLHMAGQRLHLAAEGLHFAAQGLSVAPMQQICSICCVWLGQAEQPGSRQCAQSVVARAVWGPYLTAWGWRFKAEIYHNAGSRLKECSQTVG